ncbi:MAG TPA: histidine kinase [Cyclobacteriaceae bacterium]|nr:histidine kinase [Cyclobacteriaceae bacterium]
MKLPQFLTKLRWLILVALVILWIAFHAWFMHGKLGVEYRLAVADSATSNLMVLFVSALVIIVLRRYMPEGGKLWFAAAVSLFLSLVCVWLTLEIIMRLAMDNLDYITLLGKTGPLRWSFNFLLMGGLVMGSVLHFRLHDQKEVTERQAATVAMVREAELQKLQLQLQPHFLFNCLNSINALIIVRPEEARKMVEQLSEFLRITLRRADEHWIKLRDEWHYLQLYLEIEKIRFGHRLEVVTTFEEESLDRQMPTLLLQPLVENAIKFGLYGTTGNVTITIDAVLRGQLMEIRVTNPYSDDAQATKGNGFGLTGLRRRLYLLFARNDLLKTEENDNIYTVILKIPHKA